MVSHKRFIDCDLDNNIYTLSYSNELEANLCLEDNHKDYYYHYNYHLIITIIGYHYGFN